jgi:hypothetical protein
MFEVSEEFLPCFPPSPVVAAITGYRVLAQAANETSFTVTDAGKEDVSIPGMVSVLLIIPPTGAVSGGWAAGG